MRDAVNLLRVSGFGETSEYITTSVPGSRIARPVLWLTSGNNPSGTPVDSRKRTPAFERTRGVYCTDLPRGRTPFGPTITQT
jgi:hypothetical protein